MEKTKNCNRIPDTRSITAKCSHYNKKSIGTIHVHANTLAWYAIRPVAKSFRYPERITGKYKKHIRHIVFRVRDERKTTVGIRCKTVLTKDERVTGTRMSVRFLSEATGGCMKYVG